MSAHRFFLTRPLATAGECVLPLSDEDVHHALEVLRVRVGETIEVVEPAGRAWSVRVTEAVRAGVRGEVLEELAVAAEPHVTLFQGVAKGEKMDDIVRQAVEVGAERIVPVLTARSVVKLDGRKRAAKGERWRRVAASAAKQAHRAFVPEVADPMTLRDALPLLATSDIALVLWEDATREAGIRSLLETHAAGVDSRVALVIGPEGGLAAEEVDALTRSGAHIASLGAHILRTETAAVVALALAIEALGGMGGASA